jgi:hypothetical protein
MIESLLKNLRQKRHQDWRYFRTGDELWFFYATDYEQIWFPEGPTPQSHPRTMTSTQKVMGSIFRSSLGFPVTAVLRPRIKFTAAYFCSGAIPKIIEEMPFDLADSPGQLMLHKDNTTSHRAQESITCLKKFRIHPTDHPPYSSDLATSDFHLLGS